MEDIDRQKILILMVYCVKRRIGRYIDRDIQISRHREKYQTVLLS